MRGYCKNSKTMDVLSGLCVLCVIFLNSLSVYGFNIEVFNYTLFRVNEESMFGFTVAVHKQAYNRGWVLVGAPEARSQYQGNKVQRGGAVYKCRPEAEHSCEEIPFDREGNQYIGIKEMDQKSYQWFGASLSTSGNHTGGPIVACAPRYVWYSREMNRRDPVGTCFVADSYFEKFEEYSPCRTSNWGYHRQGSCQAGFSAAINSEGDRLFVGAPGSYYWQGQMYSIDAYARFNYTPGLLGRTYGAKGSVHQQSLEVRPAVFQTREGKQQDDDSYMGYSTIAGDFLGNGEQGIAVGMPRGAELHGKVLLFTWNLTNYKNISSSQLGSYFGYSLAAADVDGDSKLDLIVGAPLHTEPNTEDKYDVGRVYVFYQGGGSSSFNKTSFIDGTNSKGRFGHSVGYLGDLNQDGYEDFAVGAPYDGENNKGAVYIYYGSSQGVLEKYGQVIYAEDVEGYNGIPLSTFGFSVAGGLDMDGNDYPDMAVGAYLSNSAFFFRARPVVRVEAFVRFRTRNKQIDIKTKDCKIGQTPHTCTTIDFCIKYSGKGIPEAIRLNVQYILDTKKPNVPRMAFLKSNSHTLNETIYLRKDSPDTCQTEQIYIKNEIRDKLTQLEAEVKYFMIEEQGAQHYGRRYPRSALTPVLDLNLPPSRKDSIIIQKNCGSDNICIPNLQISVTKNVEKYLLDSNTNLEFDVIVSNLGEDSFETTFEVTYPEGIYYRKYEPKNNDVLCSAGTNRTISCDIGNPLPANKIANFKMIFVPYHKEGMMQTYIFEMRANSTNPEDKTTTDDNYKNVTIDIWVDSALEVSGRSIPQEIYLPNTTQYTSAEITKESEIGPQVVHLYTLKNKGPATIDEAEMHFLWPWQTLAGEDLLYLVEPPHVPEGVKCELVPANYKNYQLDFYSKPIWERLQIDASSHNFQKSYDSVKVESGMNITGVAGGTQISGQATKLDEEISSSSGDASVVYERRHNQTTSSSGGGGQAHWSTGSSGQSSSGLDGNMKAGHTVYTKSEWRQFNVDGKPVTKWVNVTTVKDASGKIINTTYSTDDSTSGGNFDSFGQTFGNQKGTHSKVIYSSTGNDGVVPSSADLSVSSKQVSTAEGSSNRHQDTVSGGGGGYSNEKTSHAQHNYILGGGEYEGGGKQVASKTNEETIIREGQQISTGGSPTATVDEAYLNRQRYEEKRQYEERLRQQQEYEERLRQQQEYEERQRQQQEQQRKLYEQNSRGKGQNAITDDEERRRNEEYIRVQEERRRQQMSSGYDNQRTDSEIRRKQEEERQRIDEQYRQEQERYREQLRRQEELKSQEEKQRRQYELEEKRRQEEERLRQWQSNSGGSYSGQRGQGGSSYWQQQGGSRGGRVRTGYFDSQGIYRDETGTQTQHNGGLQGNPNGGVIFNKTWTSEATVDLGDGDTSGAHVYDQQQGQGAQFNFGQAGGSGSGFTAQTIDLGGGGMIGGGSSNSGGSSASESGGARQWVNSGQRTRGGTFSGTLEGGVADQDFYQSEWQRGRWEDANNPGRDNVATDTPDLSRRRGKRQVELDPNIADYLKCTATKCVFVKCVVGKLKKDEFISIVLRSRLNARAVRQLSTTQPIKLSSMMVAKISKLPYIGTPKEQALYSHEIFTDIPAGEQEIPPQFVPLWIILLSAIAGTLILLLVILLLYKCGFFKRKRPTSIPERQPLRSNGYHPGDEAL
ncbi:integrin subunit alpha inflated isoform X1 [Rhynchophorus ferrugineus]|uniref:integrin subunit alpha inflated isoform X1 n=1 Tax=Rhynchophorus ferrugineus TaxID=354439 RepID=UPI003FCDDC34